MAPDKQLHLALGFGIAGACALIVGMVARDLHGVLPVVLQPLAQPVPAALVGLLVGERAGWLKEYRFDAGGGGTVDRADYLYTARGAALGAVLGGAILAVLGRVA